MNVEGPKRPLGATAALEVENLLVEFDGLVALNRVTLSVGRGEVVAVIGPNGSGKTTLINAITGLVKPRSGEVTLDGRGLLGDPPHRRRKAGLGRTYQHAELVDEFSVFENVLMGTIHGRRASSLLREAISTSTGRRRIGKELVSAVESALAEVGLQSIGSAIATDLPFGTKKLVDLARATVSRPRFLLLDEPTAGIAESDYSSVQQSINRLSNEGVGMIVVAHHLNFVDQVAHRVVCLSTGSILATGTPQEIRKNPKVIDAYIGVGSQ